jgi:hypothetical protein
MSNMHGFLQTNVWNHMQQATLFCTSGGWSSWTLLTQQGKSFLPLLLFDKMSEHASLLQKPM